MVRAHSSSRWVLFSFSDCELHVRKRHVAVLLCPEEEAAFFSLRRAKGGVKL
jgi:hypothetical protein